MVNQMEEQCFERLLSSIYQETNFTDQKLEILFTSRGFFSAYQASRLLYAFASPPDKLRAIEIMEPRLCRMTCLEARDIIGAVTIHADKLKVLQSIKRYLIDSQSVHGMEQILIAYPFEMYKHSAVGVLQTIRHDVRDALASGGHQGYSALGGLYTQCRPLQPHLYGSLEQQAFLQPGKGRIEVPVGANTTLIPSIYSGHPTYAFPQGRDYTEDRNYPGNSAYNEN